MAEFIGTIKEFTRFVGPYARLQVAFLSSKHKKERGCCEDCGDSTKTLEAAHVKGMERAVLVARILCEFIEDGIVRINLDEFKERFMQAHMPISNSIRVLCNTCHREYDRKHKVVKEVLDKKVLKDESAIIETLIDSQMNKSKAFKLCYSRGITSLTNTNTIFSNVITSQQGWWLEPKNEKFKTSLHIILNDEKHQKVYVFKLPANAIANPTVHFKQRNDQYRPDCSDIYIPTDGTKFKEKNGFDFTPFLVEAIPYE